MKRFIFFLIVLFGLAGNVSAQNVSLLNPYRYAAAATCSPTDTDAAALLTAAGITDPTTCSAVDNLFIAAKAHGYYSNYIHWNLLIGACTINAKSPGTKDATLPNGGTITNGFKGNGTNQYINSNTFGDDPGQDDISLTIFICDNINEGSVDGGYVNSTQTDIQLNGGTFYGDLNTNGSFPYTVYTPATTRGCFTINRVLSTEFKAYYNGTAVNTATHNSQAPEHLKFFFGAINSNTTPASFSTKTIGIYDISTGLTPTQIADKSTDYTAFINAMSR